MQITGLENADKETIKIIKKATRGKKGLPFKCNPYYVTDKDLIEIKKNKYGIILSIKVQIGDKFYKAKKREWMYDVDKQGVMFMGKNFAGSHST